ncbi:hypothetical protein SACS_1501 [Parasaccharibacter apium]|uniref:Uncharacterized protein n=1 Tax=Parasaccharibacter apium TaxID=1510841 RepID=A0A7U7G6S0_9PROT|nr:hypothetical protein SACS_1501 [Parasaccharibacter apium]
MVFTAGAFCGLLPGEEGAKTLAGDGELYHIMWHEETAPMSRPARAGGGC